LGAERATIGVGLHEALDDLDAFFLTSTGASAPTTMTRNFVEAWSEQHVTNLLAVKSKEPSTGLYNLETFLDRVRDFYLERSRPVANVIASHCLVFITAPSEGPDFFTRLDNHTRVGHAITSAFCHGEAATTLAADRYAIFAHDQADAHSKLALVRQRVSGDQGVGPIEFNGHHASLPTTISGTVNLLVRHGAESLRSFPASTHFA
jgi:hypothetical protein